MSKSFWASVLGFVVLAAVVGIVLAGVMGWASVEEGHEKVLKYKGESQTALTPGTWYWHNPLTHSYEKIDMRPQIYTMVDRSDEGEKGGDDSIHVKNADQLNVPVDVAVTYKVTDSVAFHDEWKGHTKARNILIRNPTRDVVYTVGGSMTTENMTSDEGRERMKQAIRERLNERFDGEPVELLTVEIRDVRPPQQYMDEKRKVKEEQQRVIQSELRADQRIKEAEGEAEANRIVQESLSDSLLTYRQIQALENGTTVYVPVGDDGLPMYVNANDTANTDTNSTADDNQARPARAEVTG